MSKCIFCKIVNNEASSHKIWEDPQYCAFLDINPVNPGHTLIIPKTHIDYIFDMEKASYTEIFQIARQLAGPLKEAMGARRIGIAVEGFGVPHVHIHLVPINELADLDPNRAKRATSEELSKIAEQIRRQIEKI